MQLDPSGDIFSSPISVNLENQSSPYRCVSGKDSAIDPTQIISDNQYSLDISENICSTTVNQSQNASKLSANIFNSQCLGSETDGKECFNETSLNSSRLTLLQLAEPVLAYCQLLIASEQRSTNETLQFRETVKHLRSIFDDGNARERRDIDTLTQFPKILKILDTKYYELKDKAKTLATECQEDRDKAHAMYDAAVARLQDVETELFSAQAIYGRQKIELRSLQEITKNQKSHTEATEFLERLAQLEIQNKELGIEKRTLERQIEEAQESLEQILLKQKNIEDADDDLIKSYAPNNSNISNKKVAELLEKLESFKKQAADEKREFESILENENQLTLAAKQEAEALLAKIE